MKILFICLGNICRSPMAEGLFLHHINTLGYNETIFADSCGTGGWHAGELADIRMRDTALKHGIKLTHKARQIKSSDFHEFDYLLVMDEQNYKDVIRINSDMKHKVQLMSELSNTHKGKIVPDPYFGEISGFEEVFELLNQISQEIAQNLCKQ